ncbi:MAG: hypothetical protein AAFR96_02695 [Planctomycetota bacterium]
MKTPGTRIGLGMLVLAAGVLGGCVKVRTLPVADNAETARLDEEASVAIFAADNPYELFDVRSTSPELDGAETVGHLVVSRSFAGLVCRADDEHIIDVAKKRARRLGGDSIVVLRWSTTDVRREDVAALPVPLPELPDESSLAERWVALGMIAAADPATVLPVLATGAVAYAVEREMDDFWLFGRPPVSMTARVVRRGSAADGLGLEVEPGESGADVVEHVHEVDVTVVR